MEKELCFKFLEHLYKYSAGMLKKDHLTEMDITYINNEVDNFLKRLDPAKTAEYDKSGALGKVERIKDETKTDKAVNLSMSLLKKKYTLFGSLFGGSKDDAQIQRFNKITEFNARIKQVIVFLDFSQ